LNVKTTSKDKPISAFTEQEFFVTLYDPVGLILRQYEQNKQPEDVICSPELVVGPDIKIVLDLPIGRDGAGGTL